MWDGARYKLEYSADGYLPRTAIIDASAVERGVDLTTAWRINMDVELYPLSMEDEAPPMELGECIYETSRGNFRWTDREARKEFPIKRYREPRIVAHAALVDSVSTLDGVMLQGRTLAQVGENELENVQVHVRSQDGAVDTTLVTDRFGFYIYSLPFEKEYDLTFSRQDLVSKKLSIDLTGIPEQRQENGFSTILDVRLFPPIEDEDLSFLDRPLGRMRYMPSVDNLSWDVEYSRPLLERLDDILSRHMATSSVR